MPARAQRGRKPAPALSPRRHCWLRRCSGTQTPTTRYLQSSPWGKSRGYRKPLHRRARPRFSAYPGRTTLQVEPPSLTSLTAQGSTGPRREQPEALGSPGQGRLAANPHHALGCFSDPSPKETGVREQRVHQNHTDSAAKQDQLCRAQSRASGSV